mmetsp:Transcript_14686/g.16978  ORF Transcript_14686/g.16978 Transcript_14686/m.16978 type:complete len:83 (+) Transcript_14686:5182-5430(+)
MFAGPKFLLKSPKTNPETKQETPKGKQPDANNLNESVDSEAFDVQEHSFGEDIICLHDLNPAVPEHNYHLKGHWDPFLHRLS